MKEALRAVLLPFAATRAALFVAGLLAGALLPSGLLLQNGNLVRHAQDPLPLSIWARWDAEWYLLIAERGYGADDAFVGLPVNYRSGDDSGFFPLYPLLIRAVSVPGPSPLAAAILVSNLALLLAAALLWDLVRRDRSEDEARRAVWLLLSFPTSFFLSAVYAESLLLATTLAAVRWARAGRPLAAGAMAALASVARPTGVLALLPVVFELGRDGTAGARLRRVGAALVPPAVALGGWLAFCHARFGEWAPFVARQERWRGAMSGPWRAFVRYFESPEIHGAHHSTIDFIVAALLVLSIPWMFRRLRRGDAVYGAVAILLPLGSTLWSFSRFASVVYPLPMLLARAGAARPDRHAALVAAGMGLGGFLMAFYAAWWWVG